MKHYYKSLFSSHKESLDCVLTSYIDSYQLESFFSNTVLLITVITEIMLKNIYLGSKVH